MNFVRKLSTLFSVLTARPLYWAGSLVPKDEHLWVFIGWHEGAEKEIFADNTKYLFLHVSANVPSIRAVWLARDEALAAELRKKGFEACRLKSMRGIWMALRASHTCADAYLSRESFRWSGGSKLVQLLHGKGMKKGGYAKPQYRSHDFVFGPSQFALDLLPTSFTKNASMHVTGYPRDDLFLRPIPGSDISVDEKTAALLTRTRAEGKKCILYAPTYRRGKELSLEQALDPKRASAWCGERNIELFISLHPKYRYVARAEDLPHVHFVPESDLYPLLPKFNLLVTDYSSIFTDALLLDIPLVFYPYDIKEYEAAEGFIVEYDTHTPGEKAYSFEELLRAVEKNLKEDTYAEERARVRALYHSFTDGRASVRIVNILLKKR